MKLETKDNTLMVYGMVKSFSDTQELKDAIEAIAQEHDSVVVDFIDAYSLASSVIGFLNKKIHADGVSIEVIARQEEFYELMQILSLTQTLKVKKHS